jgi:Fe-Mn family superoxide dismutase
LSLMLPPLPYAYDALDPHISSRTLQIHHGKHHKAYVDKVNELVAGTAQAEASLDGIVKFAARGKETALFNAAAQAWNHEFQWKCLSPMGGGAPKGAIKQRIEADFGNYENFADLFQKAAIGHFGSGWVWLVADRGVLRITTTSNADTPIVRDQVPLLTIDVWEHAYYLDYQNRRADYVAGTVKHVVNWEFANGVLEAALQPQTR